MLRIQDKFGQETVSIALDVTLKVGMKREKLQSIMLSDPLHKLHNEYRNIGRAHGIS